jgi:hypothetical protein
MLNGYRTIISSAVTLLAAILREMQIEIDTEGVVNSILIIGGAVSAIYFRLKATKIH